MPNKINTFIFDCFGVLCHPPFSGWYKDNMTAKGFADENFNNLLNDYDLGNITEDEIYMSLSKYQGISSNEKEVRNQVDSYLKFDEKLADIILKLKKLGFKTALLSNGNNSFFERKIYTTYPKFKELFDDIIISSNVKIMKPDPSIYIHTLNKINSKPEESLFIDDRKINIDGARDVGIHGYLYIDSNLFAEYIKSFGINLEN